MPHSGLCARRSHQRLAFSVEAFEHLLLGELGQDFRHRRVGIKLAAVHQNHRGGAAHGLGHRVDAEDRIVRCGHAGSGLAGTTAPAHAVAATDHRDSKGNILPFYGGADHIIKFTHDSLLMFGVASVRQATLAL
jgi:hypothetical protein